MPSKAKPKPKAKAAARATPRKTPPAPKSAAKKSPARKAKPKASAAAGASGAAASRRIDERIRSLDDWRGETLAQVRRWIHEADPDIIEEVKWVKPTNPWGVPVWSHAGIVCTGEAYKEAVKLTFARGATIPDPRRLFNASLDAGTRRAIDIGEEHALDADAFRELVRAAVMLNLRASAGKMKR